VVDVQKASGQTSEVRGEENGTYQYFGRVFFADLGPARFGVEAGIPWRMASMSRVSFLPAAGRQAFIRGGRMNGTLPRFRGSTGP